LTDTLEKGPVFRATIEPDSQDVFLHVQLFRTLPYFELILSATWILMGAQRREFWLHHSVPPPLEWAGMGFCLPLHHLIARPYQVLPAGLEQGKRQGN
jgi:hypothetical protein